MGDGNRQSRIVESREAEKIVESAVEMAKAVIEAVCPRRVSMGSSSAALGLN